MKVLFLDIDGVLNHTVFFNTVPTAHEDPIDEESVFELNGIILDTGALVVVSSDWRRHHSAADLHKRLVDKGFKGRVIDTTPVLDSPSLSRRDLERTRVEEINLWLQTHPGVSSWVAIDDMDLAQGGLDPQHFVKTSFVTGLTQHQAFEATSKLR